MEVAEEKASWGDWSRAEIAVPGGWDVAQQLLLSALEQPI